MHLWHPKFEAVHASAVGATRCWMVACCAVSVQGVGAAAGRRRVCSGRAAAEACAALAAPAGGHGGSGSKMAKRGAVRCFNSFY